MSLIADALKAAQSEKRRKNAPPRAFGPQPTYFPLRAAGRGGKRISTPMIVGLAVAVPAALIAAFFATRGGGPQRAAGGARVALSPPVAESVLVDTAMSATGSDAPSPATGEIAQSEPAGEPAAEQIVPSPRSGARSSAARRRETAIADASRPTTLPPPLTTGPSGTAITGGTASRLPGGLQITMGSASAADAADLFQQGLAAQRRGDPMRARELYLSALALDPNNPEFNNNLGLVHKSLNDFASAEASFRRAIAADQRYAAAWSNLGVVLTALGRTPEAIEALRRAVQLQPGNLGAKVNLAIQYLSAGLSADAQRLLDEVLRTDPSVAEAHYALAQVFERKGERAEAIRHYRLFLSTGVGRFPQQEEQVRRHLLTLR